MVINFDNKIIFRADASITLGNGHVMRCLTLADELKAHGAQCIFICRKQSGDAIDLIMNHGHIVHSLPSVNSAKQTAHDLDEDRDALDSIAYLKSLVPDLVIVDHYSLGIQWERQIKRHCLNLMVIDDLANRCHECTILLDQGLKRKKEDYSQFVGAQCNMLIGQHYSILRHEFSQIRPYSLQRRNTAKVQHILVSMGGTDQPDATGYVIEGLKKCKLAQDCIITIVMGSKAPWLDKIKNQVTTLPWQTRVLIDTSNMAALMADSDLAIGAVGGTAWERCCLGLPTLMVILANNQKEGAYALEACGAGKLLGTPDKIEQKLPKVLDALITNPHMLYSMSLSASKVTDGNGIQNIFAEVGKII